MPNCCSDFSDCGGLVYSSNCVAYEGNDISFPIISQGDDLTTVIVTFSGSINDLSNGRNISLPDVTISNCQSISDLVGSKDKNLVNVLQALVDNQCVLKSSIDNKNTQPTYIFDNKCLTFSDNSLQTVVQSIINQACQNSSGVSSLNSKVSANTSSIQSLQTQVNNIIGNQDSPTLPIFTFSQLMPPYVPVPYIGSLSNFDSTGAGKPSLGYGNVYIMNGQNGTQDWRGYTPVGATSGIPGGVLDARVLPGNNNGFQLSPGGKAGEFYHKTTVNEIPSHSHDINDPGHSHSYERRSNGNGGTIGYGYATNHTSSLVKDTSDPSKTGISLQPTGGSQSHNNIQPSVGVVWIVKIP